jgi:hypothetical protein
MAVSMTIWTSGSSALRRAVHSMPDMRGRKISINTTSGSLRGMVASASSALRQEHTQVKSGNELMSRVQFSRAFV